MLGAALNSRRKSMKRLVPKLSTWSGSLKDFKSLVIYEDNHIIGAFKPAGAPSQGDNTRDESLFAATKEFLRTKYSKAGDAYLGLVHRLDRPCSGAMVFAKTSKAAARLSEMFRERKIIKKYIAVVEGHVEGSQERVDYIQKHGTINKARLVMKEDEGVKARLKFTALQQLTSTSGAPYTLISVDLLTGRKHQIRAQMAAAGYAIAGDVKYGATVGFPERDIALHAYLLSFYHPVTDKQLVLSAAVPMIWTERFGVSVASHANRLIESFVAKSTSPDDRMVYTYR